MNFDRRLNRVVRLAHREAFFATVALLCLCLGLVRCTHQQVWVATGETIDGLGKTFLVTAHAIDAAYDAHLVTEPQYEKWRVFVKYFQPAYDLAADRWEHGDDSAAKHAAVVLAQLAAELAEFTSMSNPKGAP